MSKKKQISRPLKFAKKLLYVGIPFCLVTPILFTLNFNLIDFTSTGDIGDTIGGITAPFIGILGAILVFLALNAQVQANIIIQEQIDAQNEEKRQDNESNLLNLYYLNLKTGIDTYKYTTIDRFTIGETNNIELSGSEGIYKLFQDFYCDFHADEDEMRCNPKITEVISLLEICEELLDRIEQSNTPNKDALWLLTKHQFAYRIFPRLSSDFPDNLETHYCEECSRNHGLPNRIVELIKNIVNKTNLEVKKC